MRPRSKALWLALLLAACGRDKPATPEAPPVVPPASLAEVSDLPADTQVILEARVAPLAASPVVRSLVEKVLSRDADAAARLEGLLARCKLDLARDVERITVAMRQPTDVALIVRGRLDEAALLECIKAEAGNLTTTRRGGLAIHATTGAASRVWLTFTGGLLVASSSEAWLETLLDGKRAKLSPATLDKVDRSAPLWGAGSMPPGVGDRLTELTRGAVKQPARAVSFHVTTRDAAVDAALRIEMNDEADARELAAFAGGQLDLLAIAAQRFGLGRLVARTQITADGAGVKLALRLDENDVRLLEGALGQAANQDEKEQAR